MELRISKLIRWYVDVIGDIFGGFHSQTAKSWCGSARGESHAGEWEQTRSVVFVLLL